MIFDEGHSMSSINLLKEYDYYGKTNVQPWITALCGLARPPVGGAAEFQARYVAHPGFVPVP